jgi:Flp pilus assembly protein TadD
VQADHAGDIAGAVAAYREALALFGAMPSLAGNPTLAALVDGYRKRAAELEAHVAAATK